MSWNSHYSDKQPPKSILRASSKPSRYHFQRLRPTETDSKKDEDELLVFGYACKLFPPDDHSRDIFKLRHLIPWNGDHNLQLMIDRYDARASLHDLSDFDGDSWNTEYEMSEEEARIEQLCDQERYMAMYTDIAEEKLRHEEELKRLHASIGGEDNFNQVGFTYENSSDVKAENTPPPEVKSSDQNEKPQVEEEEEEKPFMAPVSLAIPTNMEIPPTEKMHAIIEKTALFVSKQGVQMEIILKAKQANSSQFLFLEFDHYLNPYYKHVLKRIKEGKYTPGMKTEQEQEEEDEESDSDDEGGYLHPSLFANAQRSKQEEEEKKEKLKAIQKVDPNHPLAKLIEKKKKDNAMRQYNLMKLSSHGYSRDVESSLESSTLTKFVENNNGRNVSNPSSPLTVQDQEALPRNITPQEAAMVIVPPPPDIQPMVDNVAKQVAEEGDSVEKSMRDRKDPLLAFLEPSHELHPYYTFRKTFIREQLKARKRMLEKAKELAAAEKQSNPISFSIKGKEVVPKTTLISTRLQVLEDDSDQEENESNGVQNNDGSEVKENNSNEEKEAVAKPKEKSKRKFVEISVVEGIKPKAEPEIQPALVMTAEDRSRLLEQSKRKFTDAPLVPITPVVPVTPQPSISNFTVVTPDGSTMSIAEFREKQQERRQKAAQEALEKAKVATQAIVKAEAIKVKEKDPASEDIFGDTDSEEDESSAQEITSTSPVDKSYKRDKPRQATRSPSVERKSSPALSAPPARTLKDLIVAASRSSTPSSKDGKRNRSRSRSRERSRSSSRPRQLSPRRRRPSRSRSRSRDYIPSSYKKMLGSTRSRKYDDNDVSVPSAYKIENPSYEINSYSRYRRRDPSPSYRHAHKRRRNSPEEDKSSSRRKRRSHNSPSPKNKKKHSKSKKKHKKKKSKSKKSKKRSKNSSSDDEKSSDSDSSEVDKKKSRTKIKVNGKSPSSNREEGELSPTSSQEMNAG